MLLFMDRTKRGSDPWLPWKVRLFQGGAAVAVIGMVMESGWMVGAATVILAAGFALRFIPHPSREEDGAEESA